MRRYTTLRGARVGVLQQGRCLLQRLGIAADLGAQIVFGEPDLHVRLLEHPVHEALPHRIPAVRLAGILVDVAFATTVAEEERREHWPHGDREVYRFPALSHPLVLIDRRLASPFGGLVRIRVFPLSTTMGTIGTFTRSAEDAALVFAVMSGETTSPPRPLKGLRLGRPGAHFFDGLGRGVAAATERALRQLEAAGVVIVPIELPEAAEIDTIFAPIVAVELLATLGAERFASAKDTLDPIVWDRGAPALRFLAVDYVRQRRRQEVLYHVATERMLGLDAWISATSPDVVLPVGDFQDPAKAAAWIRRNTHNTRPINLFGQCAASIPLPGSGLPVGLQVVCGAGRDSDLIGISQGIEALLGRRTLPAASEFLRTPTAQPPGEARVD